MIITVTTTRRERQFVAKCTTSAGALVGQAVDHSEAEAEKRAKRQARKFGADRDWGTLTFRKGKVRT